MNFRPPAPEAGALPSCATPRFMCFKISRFTIQRESGREDLNLRLLAPHASALPSCATPRLYGMFPLQQGHCFMDVFLQQGKCRPEVGRCRRASSKAVRVIPSLLAWQAVLHFIKRFRNPLVGIVGRTALISQQLSRTRNRIAIRVKEILDLHECSDVCLRIQTLPGGVLFWF